MRTLFSQKTMRGKQIFEQKNQFKIPFLVTLARFCFYQKKRFLARALSNLEPTGAEDTFM